MRGLTKRYGAVEALRGISFEVSSGEIFGLVGRNGAGKTTAFECLLGLKRPDAGTISIAGIDTLTAPQRAKALVGAQLQASALPDKITPREALCFTASFYRDTTPVDEMLERFSLGPKAGARFDSLSGGQKQRLFLALAFVHRPRVLVLDEPTVGLDPQSRRELHALIRQLRADGTTVLLSTHYLAEAELLCDRIGVLHAGALLVVGTPAEMIGRSRSLPRLVVRTARPLDQAAMEALDGVAECRTNGDAWEILTRHINPALVAVAQLIASTNNTLIDLQIRRPTLEDVFVELTGSAWTEKETA